MNGFFLKNVIFNCYVSLPLPAKSENYFKTNIRLSEQNDNSVYLNQSSEVKNNFKTNMSKTVNTEPSQSKILKCQF